MNSRYIEAESNSHLFLHCGVTGLLCQLFLKSGGLETKEMVPACIWWTIGKEKKDMCFEGRYSSIKKNKMFCLLLFHYWGKGSYVQDASFICGITLGMSLLCRMPTL